MKRADLLMASFHSQIMRFFERLLGFDGEIVEGGHMFGNAFENLRKTPPRFCSSQASSLVPPSAGHRGRPSAERFQSHFLTYDRSGGDDGNDTYIYLLP